MAGIDKRYYLLQGVLTAGAFYMFMLWPLPQIPQRINMLVVQNREDIVSLDQPRTWANWLHDNIDIVSFPSAWELTHYSAGKLGMRDNIFIDLKTEMRVPRDGQYEFIVTTDYFSKSYTRFSISGEEIGRHTGEQVSSSFVAHLREGGNILEINYMHTCGIHSLRVFYKAPGDNKLYLVGQNSQTAHFYWVPLLSD